MKPNLLTMLEECFSQETVQRELRESDCTSFFKIDHKDGEILIEMNPGRLMEFRVLIRGETLVNALNFQDLLSVFPFIEDDIDELFHPDTDINAWSITPGTDFHGLPLEYMDILDYFGIPWKRIYWITSLEIDKDEKGEYDYIALYLTITITDYAS